MDPDDVTRVIFRQRSNPDIVLPTLASLAELEAIVEEGLSKLEDDRPWHAVDDFDALESGTIPVSKR